MCVCVYIYIYILWEPKMCRLALQLLGMLGVLGMLCNVLGMLATSSADIGMLLQGPRSPTSKRNPPTCCLISCEAKGVVYHQVSYMEAWWYTTPLASQFIRQQVGGVSLQCGTPRTLQKHAEVSRGRCKHA